MQKIWDFLPKYFAVSYKISNFAVHLGNKDA